MPAEYQFVGYNLRTRVKIVDLPLEGVTYGRILNGAGALSATLKLPHIANRDAGKIEQARRYIEATDPARSGIMIERNGVIVWAGPVWTRTYDAGTASIIIEAAETWSYFRHRRILADQTFNGEDQFTIARDLIDYAQAQAGGGIGVDTSDATLSGVTRDRVYPAHEVKGIGEAVEQLAAVEDGFDFSIDPRWSSDGSTLELPLVLSYPERGHTDPGERILELGNNVVSFAWGEDGARMANRFIGVGAGEGEAMLRSSSIDLNSINTHGYPLLEDSRAWKDVTVQATLDKHVTAARRARRLPITLPTVTVKGDKTPQVGSYTTGDMCRLIVPRNKDPRFPDGLDVTRRILAYDVTVGDTGTETVTLTLNEKVALDA